MKILQVGNANFGYVMTKELRKRGIKADLLIPKQMIEDTMTEINNPLNHDKELDQLPKWIYI